MPFYDYRCRGCGAKVSIFRKIAEYDVPPGPDEHPCPTPTDPQWSKELGATPTSFRHNDSTAYKS